MRAWARMFPHIWRYSTVFCAQMLVNASLHQSALSWRWLTTVICAQTFRQDDPCPQKTKAFKASNVLCDLGSVVCATTGVFCENCTVASHYVSIWFAFLLAMKSLIFFGHFFFIFNSAWLCQQSSWNRNLSVVCRPSVRRPSVRVAMISEPNSRISFKIWLLLPLSHTLGRFFFCFDFIFF